MKKPFIFLALILSFYQLYSQFIYERYDSAQVNINGRALNFPFVGGMNAPQFSEIDLNQDGIMDLLVFDRSGDRVMTFINEGISDSVSYLYRPEYESTFPEARDFLLAVDYNCDGRSDLFSRRTGIIAYTNTTTNNQLSFSSRIKVTSNYRPNSDIIYSKSPSLPGFNDIDNDGDIDIIVPEGFTGQMFEYHKNLSMENNNNCGLVYERRSKCWGKVTESNSNATIYLDSCRFPDYEDSELEGRTKNNGNLNKSTKHGDASIALFDLDKNGSMDMVLGDDGSSRLSALYNEDSVAPHTNSFFNSYDTLFPNYDQSVDLKLFPAAFFLDVDNDSIKDMIVATNSISRLPNEFSHARNNIHLYKGTGNPNTPFVFKRTDFLNRNFLDFGLGSAPTFFDHNNNGLMDILVGNEGYIDSSGNPISQLALLENTGTALKPTYQLVDDNYAHINSIPLNASSNKATSGVIPTLYDLDNDGDQDLLLGDINGNIHYFKDTSSQSQDASFTLEESTYQGIKVTNAAAPTLFDINEDSLVDLIIGYGVGELQLHLNLGSLSDPIFNLDVQSITWQSGNIIRYQLNGNPNLNLLQIGQTVDINTPLLPNNGVIQTITAINNNQKYIDCEHPFRNDGTDDETNSTAVIDYSIKKFGGIQLTKNSYNGNPVPFFYKEEGDIKLVLGSRDGRIFFYDSITNNLEGNFHLLDSNYLLNNEYYGRYLTVSGADFNNDGKTDIVMGNQNGGINLFAAQFGVGIAEKSRKQQSKALHFSLFPNPAKDHFVIKVDQLTTESRYKVYDISGKIVCEDRISKFRTTVDSKGLSNGFYIVTLLNKNGFKSQKLIIND